MGRLAACMHHTKRIRPPVLMPRIRAAICDEHDEADCQCYKQPVAVAQSLQELDYLKSACAAAQQGHENKLQNILDKHPETINTDGGEGGSGYTPLHYAARSGHYALVKLLIARGADPNRATRAGGATSLHRASYMGHSDVVRYLVDNGADVTLADSDGQTALHKAAQQGHAQLLQDLQASFPAAAAFKCKKGCTAEELLLLCKTPLNVVQQ